MTDELKQKVERIMGHCQQQSDIYNNYQLATKVVINGIYGSFGFSGFYFYNKDIAEAVTKQGKNVILNAERLINLWADKVWKKDTKTHKEMGIKITKPDEKIGTVSVYIDTDSLIFSSNININSDVIRVNDKVYHLNDEVKVMRDGKEIVITASDIKETDLIWQ